MTAETTAEKMMAIPEPRAERYAPLLHAKWEPGSGEDHIRGYWAEDGTRYKIVLPCRLRDLLIELQNGLCERYAELDDARRRLADAERTLGELLK